MIRMKTTLAVAAAVSIVIVILVQRRAVRLLHRAAIVPVDKTLNDTLREHLLAMSLVTSTTTRTTTTTVVRSIDSNPSEVSFLSIAAANMKVDYSFSGHSLRALA
jgi:hypothetical protein